MRVKRNGRCNYEDVDAGRDDSEFDESDKPPEYDRLSSDEQALRRTDTTIARLDKDETSCGHGPNPLNVLYV